jgi:hypothetical protein
VAFFCTEAEGNGGSVRAHPRGRREKERGSGAGGATRRKGRGPSVRQLHGSGRGGRRSGTVRKQGSGRRAWAARESVGRPGEGKRAGPEGT